MSPGQKKHRNLVSHRQLDCLAEPEKYIPHVGRFEKVQKEMNNLDVR